MHDTPILTLTVTDPEMTAALAARLGRRLTAGDAILLHGPVGAGKSHFARALIQARLADIGRYEDVPSPTYTLVQSYELEDVEIWHADLYRLSGAHECLELGLDQAFENAICLIEWPEKLGKLAPEGALSLHITAGDTPEARQLAFSAASGRWHRLLADMSGEILS
ncbi:tRNA (adenosine(37)-N6)-threonylcarbamoyltransferase complex ATPase subunit type 1 TsaE [Roseinatronobacter alkalisoli]|uniref:tRNA threonylcarbamoyladenosine biosynthesis protein TsaE n=1 Tax=Roseinatronobacter alkalisoli TaxID=3028235 RepID=A0ABT5T3X5_9RHOB|nr:tRNA (adenosine(37)-N6)-threonylcarbamoyltransferase complex ATPase subunit type 1 TsaE [Roseinatronobacter sp. HJB301]MDD7969821.1 tRNA (adenosine(37)-N6)-threonylcarbamoyltransferase complex ATPase subunit type 1 TsaE [Roseinatronobacter sp. HJB301]